MSDNNQLNYQQAFDTLVTNIYAPVFFDKLANDYGIRPSNEGEASEFLTLAGKLQQLHEAQQVKQANERSSIVSAANRSLDDVMHRAGVSSATHSANDREVKAAAAQLAQNQMIRDAALLYQDALLQTASQS